jgi:hypothetical protein
MQLHELIKSGKTGTPKQLAEKLEISPRSLHYYIIFMKTKMNVAIVYSKREETYSYEDECKLCFNNN